MVDGVKFEGSGPGFTMGLVASHLTGSAPTLTALGASLIDAGNFAQWFTQSTDLSTHAIAQAFTNALSGTFGYQPGAGQSFSFTGDDDVWVYFDKELGIELGGIHSAMSASVNPGPAWFGLAGHGRRQPAPSAQAGLTARLRSDQA